MSICGLSTFVDFSDISSSGIFPFFSNKSSIFDFISEKVSLYPKNFILFSVILSSKNLLRFFISSSYFFSDFPKNS